MGSRVVTGYLFVVLLTDAINKKGYGWYFDNIVNNKYGKWPLVVSSDNFEVDKFDVATVSGRLILLPQCEDYFRDLLHSLMFYLIFTLLLILGMITRKFGDSVVIGADVRQDSMDSSRNVIYVCVP